MILYTTEGPDSGWCGHKHKSLRAASFCIMQGSFGHLTHLSRYADRQVVRCDGVPLTEKEELEIRRCRESLKTWPCQ